MILMITIFSNTDVSNELSSQMPLSAQPQNLSFMGNGGWRMEEEVGERERVAKKAD